jgi:hypothetical protein
MGTENVDPIVDSSTTSMATENVEPIVDSSTTSMATENVEPIVDSSTTSMATENVEPIVDSNTTSMTTENVEPIVDSSTTSMGTENAIVNEDNDIPLSTKTLNITQPVEDDDIDPFEDSSGTFVDPDIVERSVSSSTTSVEANNVEKPTNDLTNIQPNNVPSKKELMNSLTNVVDYITDVVSDRVSQNVTASQFGEKPQNGFDAVNAAAEMMAKSGGKRKKTRKFKLTKKNKTNKK